jgi:Ca2+-binding EF-hand superfamily protein
MIGKLVTGWCVGVAVLVVGSAVAEEGKSFVDRNKDGEIRWEDVAVVTPEGAGKLDADEDGVISLREFVRGTRQGALQDMLKAADKDGDKAISEEEWEAIGPAAGASAGTFKNLDLNKDGKINAKDLAARGPRPGQGPGMRPSASGGAPEKGGAAKKKEGGKGNAKKENTKVKGEKGVGKKGKGSSDSGTLMRSALMEDADADGDGKLTLEEVQSAKPGFPMKAFERMDTNGDGVISKDDKGMVPGNRGGGEAYRARLRDADTDGDGKLSQEEAQKAFPRMTAEQFKQRDRNDDGYISREDRQKN